MSNQSEVTALKEQIDQECVALQRLKYEFAAVASHEMITHHYRQLDTCYLHLASHIGPEVALDLLVQRLEHFA
ncbi:MAG TPA: hypothetical protein VFV38_45050 [Ktedonobacteraceae bacterium]|nr:hypothetical protein [Ktedonobacteraceae bacterium]